MTRNLRNQDHPAPNPVSSYPIAPDFFNDGTDDNIPYYDTIKEFRQAHPYKPGMVVYMEWIDYIDGKTVKIARKAFISDLWAERAPDGFLRAKYRVHMENKKGGNFAKNWIYTWPGYIERGYQLAAKL